MPTTLFSSAGWPQQVGHGEADLLRRVGSGETGQDRGLPGREAEQRCCATPLRVSDIGP